MSTEDSKLTNIHAEPLSSAEGSDIASADTGPEDPLREFGRYMYEKYHKVTERPVESVADFLQLEEDLRAVSNEWYRDKPGPPRTEIGRSVQDDTAEVNGTAHLSLEEESAVYPSTLNGDASTARTQ
jgi:hypothetical protein